MNNEEIDDLFKKGLQDLPEKQPTDKAWSDMKIRMEKEGLLPQKTGGKRILLLLLFIVVVSATIKGVLLLNSNTTSEEAKANTDLAVKTYVSNIAQPQAAKTVTASAVKHFDENKEILNNNKTTVINHEKKTTTGLKPPSSVNEYKPIKQKENKTLVLTHKGDEPVIKEKGEEGAIKATGSRQEEKKAQAAKGADDVFVANTIAKKESSPSSKGGQPEAHETGNINQSDTGEPDQQANPASPSESKLMPKEKQQDAGNSTAFIQDTLSKTNDAENHAGPAIDSVANKNNVPGDSSATNTAGDQSVLTKKIFDVRRIHIGCIFSMDFNRYLLKKNPDVLQSDVEYVYNADGMNGIAGAPQFTAGITAGYMISNRLEIEAGFSYSKKQAVKTAVTTPDYEVDSVQGHSEYIYNYTGKYLELSGKVKYYFPWSTNKRVYAGVGGMASFNYPANASDLGYYSYALYYDTTKIAGDKVTLQPSSSTFSMLIVAGMELRLNNRWDIYIEPEYKYGISAVIKHPTFDYIPVNHFWRTFSIAVGVRFGFM